MDKDKYLYPCYPYHGHFTPQELVFNANLQEFAQRVSYISAFQTRGKISAREAYDQIHQLWQELSDSMEELGIEKD